ncbi:hypothetical protein KKC94_06010 [Patescibacteria group bacterium]|nr:hypothetical protein [Patescibacteria group bacterium]
MKSFIATLILGLLVGINLAFVMPVQAADTDTFNVSEIMSLKNVDQKTLDTTGTDIIDNKSITRRFIEESKKEGTSPVGVVILRAINILSLLIGTFAFVMFIIAGFILATASGEESKIDRGKAMISQSIAGILLAFFSYIIVTLIQSLFY